MAKGSLYCHADMWIEIYQGGCVHMCTLHSASVFSLHNKLALGTFSFSVNHFCAFIFSALFFLSRYCCLFSLLPLIIFHLNVNLFFIALLFIFCPSVVSPAFSLHLSFPLISLSLCCVFNIWKACCPPNKSFQIILCDWKYGCNRCQLDFRSNS